MKTASCLTTSGKLLEGDLQLPVGALTDLEQVNFKEEDKEDYIATEDIEWVAIEADTLFRRIEDQLCQLLVGDKYSVYRVVQSKRYNDYFYWLDGKMVKVWPKEAINIARDLMEEDCERLGRSTGREQWYDLAILGEDMASCSGKRYPYYSLLGKPQKWAVQLGISPIVGGDRSGETRSTLWLLELGVAKQLRRLYQGIQVQTHLTLFDFKNEGELGQGFGSFFLFPGTTPIPYEAYDQTWQLGGAVLTGSFRLDFLPRRRFSPYMDMGYSVLFPLYHKLRAQAKPNTDISLAGFPNSVELNGGGQVSTGSFYHFGFRYRLNDNWIAGIHGRLDNMFFNTDYGDLSSGSEQLVRSQRTYSFDRFTYRIGLWVQKRMDW